MIKALFIIVSVLVDSLFAPSQDKSAQFAGKWTYEVERNVFGEFSGILQMSLDASGQVTGVVTNAYGERFWLKVSRIHGHRIVFTSNFENSDATFFCDFYGGAFKGVIEVKGDTYLYVINGRRQTP